MVAKRVPQSLFAGLHSTNRTVGSPSASISPVDTSSESGSSEHDTKECQDQLRGEGMIRHAILLPSYKEDVDNLRETLDVLASHAQARISYDVSLCLESRLGRNIRRWNLAGMMLTFDILGLARDGRGRSQGESHCLGARRSLYGVLPHDPIHHTSLGTGRRGAGQEQ